MRKQMIRSACSGLLAAALVLSSAIVPGSVSHAAETPKDVKGHWAQSYIEKAIDAGIVAGYKDGNFRPENAVTRAEFSHMLNSALGNTGTATVSFKDVAQKDWYYADVSKAVAAGYTSGYSDNTFGPNRSITRQEAAVMLSLVVPTYGSTAVLTSYPDYSKVGSWAKSALERMVGKGYISVYSNDKKLHPQDKMTRAQAATVIVNLITKENIVKSQTDVAAAASQLSNSIYSNGLAISASSGNGSVTLDKCVVLGTLSVTGGTVTLSNSRASQATVQGSSGATLIAKGETYVQNASVANTVSLQTNSLTGTATYGTGYNNVSIVKNAVLTLGGNFNRVCYDGTGAEAVLSSGKINSLVVPAASTGTHFTAESGTTVALVTALAPTSLHGTGTITKLDAQATGTTYETKPGTVTLGSGAKAPTQSADTRSSVRVTPANKATGVNLDTNIVITFSGTMKLYGGSSISKSDIEDFVQIRKNTSGGTIIPFTASIDSNKVITLVPNSNLDKDTEYFVMIEKNKLKDASGNGNEALTSSFITGTKVGGSSTSSYFSFTPKDGIKDVDTDIKPEIVFSQDLVTYDGSAIKSGDLEDIIAFREGNSSGSKVSYTATISSDRRTITIKPEDELSENTKYYLAINSQSLKTVGGTAVPGTSVTWTTGDGSSGTSASDYMTFTPKNGKTGIAIDVEPEIYFSEKMECYDGSTLTDSDLEDIVILREKSSSGKDVKFSADIDSDKRVVTITPDDELKEDTKYYLAIDSKAIRTEKNGTRVPGASVTWTTGDDTGSSSSDYVSFSPKNKEKNVSRREEPTISFDKRVDFYNGDSIPTGRSSDLADCITFKDEDGDSVDFTASYSSSSNRITISPDSRLESDMKYTLTIKSRSFRVRANNDPIPSCSVTWTTE